VTHLLCAGSPRGRLSHESTSPKTTPLHPPPLKDPVSTQRSPFAGPPVGTNGTRTLSRPLFFPSFFSRSLSIFSFFYGCTETTRVFSFFPIWAPLRNPHPPPQSPPPPPPPSTPPAETPPIHKFILTSVLKLAEFSF